MVHKCSWGSTTALNLDVLSFFLDLRVEVIEDSGVSSLVVIIPSSLPPPRDPDVGNMIALQQISPIHIVAVQVSVLQNPKP